MDEMLVHLRSLIQELFIDLGPDATLEEMIDELKRAHEYASAEAFVDLTQEPEFASRLFRLVIGYEIDRYQMELLKKA